jgi:uncharacterized OsmC-like protein
MTGPDMIDDPEPPPESKLTRSKARWAREGKFLTGKISRPEDQRLPPGQHLTKDWPTLDLGLTPNISRQRWRLDVYGAVENPIFWDFAQFTAQPQTQFLSDIHCVTTWSRYDNAWEGLATRDLLDACRPRDEARFVVLHSHDGYTTNLALEDFAAEDALLAHSWSGQPLEQQLLGSPRLSQPRRSLGRATLFRRLKPTRSRENAGADRTLSIHGRRRKSTCRRAGSAGRAGAGLCTVRALLHLRQGRAGGQTHRNRTCGQRHRGAAVRLYGARLQRRRFCQLDHLRETRGAPAILIGHSLGGAAILAAAGQIPDAKAVVTIAAPSDPAHVTHLFKDKIEGIRTHGKVEVQLAGRPFNIKREFLDDIAEHGLMAHVAKLHKALLIMHSPTDDTVGIDNATNIFLAAKHPKSFVSLSGADHLLSGKRDAAYVADVIAAWAERYVEPVAAPVAAAPEGPRNVVVRETRTGKFQQTVTSGPHQMLADEPLAAGGADTGPGPYDLLLSALGACTSMTMRMYADRKSLPLERITVTLKHNKIHAEDCAECETRDGLIDQIDRVIAIEGTLDADQRQRLMEIADKCPVHRTLKSEVRILTREAD